MRQNKYKPYYPKIFSDAIRILEETRDENEPTSRFLKGHNFGLNIGINVLQDLQRNIEEAAK